MNGVREGLNWMLNLIRKEAEGSVAEAWRELEAERDRLRESHKKTMADLNLCQEHVISQAEMLRVANDEVVIFGMNSLRRRSHKIC